MSRRARMISASERDRSKLQAWSQQKTIESRLADRARIVLRCLDGEPVSRIASGLGVRPNTVIAWRNRFEKNGIEGLYDRPRKGKPPTYGGNFRLQVLSTLELPPPKGQARWDGPAIAKHLGASTHAVWRVLRKEGIHLFRQRSWCVSTDPEFAEKAAAIIGLYLNPPEKALVICVDEKPSIQALERAQGYVLTDNGKIVHGYKSTYKRHGTLNLFAALEVATGTIHTRTTSRKRRVEFLEFMDQVVADLPPEMEIHVILDNYCIHKKNHAWLEAHPTVYFYFTPTSASWLNMVEIWFGIFSRKVLRGSNFRGIEQLAQAIQDFVEIYGPAAKPFIWRKREVKGAQLRNTIVNLCN